ncbi:hypothetical protein P168DRAFT_269741 [Aspergillus campestris IBT 28561]|uniref:Uncharacterized protein n=1 Tax=Aspergillus campestris (strain IBT 28561) TaxID=1392248 RepID=A0A2I1D0T0_ASPC2|nr:uncharacterized protein P168DRAFT_269741 [Aspergillus campestris IBT 28561]PKY03468.1 hypothetical protein P168DRAFT_269741 [Aspergillus campestris IBT 28561]
MASSLPTLAIPGQRLGPVTTYAAGPGTHVQNAHVYASIAGPVVLDPANAGSQAKSTLTVSRNAASTGQKTSAPPSRKYNTLPAVDSIVLARVTRVQKRQVTVSILVNHSSADELRFQALIRKEDVRAVEKDRVVVDEMFRVGDIVRGSVISLGDQSFYYLTTARNDLGVVMARSEAGNMMFPVSWKEMRDPVTGQAELRKVARPF